MQSLLWLVSGVTLFLFGLRALSTGLRRGAGAYLKRWLARLTSSGLRGMLTGAVVTAIIQSSSATNVMVVGLVQARLLNVQQAISIMLGANVGTTMTSQLLVVDVSSVAPVFVFAGLLIFLWSRRLPFTERPASVQQQRAIGEGLFGLGMLFVGMDVMQSALAPFADRPSVLSTMAHLATNPYIAIVAGAIFTGVVQSSSVTTGLTMVLTSTGLIDLYGALGLVLGANVGTVATTLLASVGTSAAARRAAVADLLFNGAGVALFVPLLPTYVHLIEMTSTRVEQQVANAHSLFNVVTACLALPFVEQIAHLVTLWVKPGKQD